MLENELHDKRGRQRNIICLVEGCNSIRQKDGTYSSGTQKYRSLCPHHYYLKKKGLPANYKTLVRLRFRGCYTRGICIISGCNRLQVSKGRYNGVKRYDIYCSAHRELEKQGLPLDINLEKCSICGWVGPCDKHRIKKGIDGGTYTIENVIVVCPNCHRDYHRGFNPHQRLRRKTFLSKSG